MLSLAASLLAGSLSFAAEAAIEGEVIRLAEVADLSALPADLRGAAAGLPLGRLRSDATTATVPADVLAGQARARMPALAPWLQPQGHDVRLHRRQAADAPVVVASGAAGIAKGDPVTVRIAAGIFLIERQGIALADARAGQRLFVRTADRQVIRALCRERTP